MRFAAFGLGVLIVLISALTLAMPDRRIAFEQALMTDAGFVVIAALRIAIALLLIFAAPQARMPRAVRAFGIVVLLAGLVTPWFGTERGQTIVNALITEGPTVMRINAIVGLVSGGFLAYALRP